jgi:hypothetical protein
VVFRYEDLGAQRTVWFAADIVIIPVPTGRHRARRRSVSAVAAPGASRTSRGPG